MMASLASRTDQTGYLAGKALRLIGLAWLLALGLAWSGVAHAISVTSSPTTCQNATGIGTQAWSNAGNATASDNLYATASVNDNQTTNYLQCTGYGFTIPPGATINGITVTVERRISNTPGRDAAVRLVKNGTIGIADRSTATAYTTADVSESHGSATDLWGTAWTPADINSANFGAAFAAVKNGTSGGNRTISVDQIRITVDYTFPCVPPANAPAGLTLSCVCDNFDRPSLNPSPIFGANWRVSTSDSTGIVPNITNPGYLRLTNNTNDNAKAATVPGIFPASGNYISVEFQLHAYNGNSADGIGLTLSDYSVPAVPGAFGGSLGYAQKTGIEGFAGGWIGVGFDEYGNYQNPTEGRVGGVGARAQSVGIRGSGSGTTGYPWLAGTAANLSPRIDSPTSTTPAPGHLYQVIVDARNEPTSTTVSVNRDTGNGYVNLTNLPNVYTAAQAQGAVQTPVPANWQISFTGSTGTNINIHEISNVRICSQTTAPPSGGTAVGFNAIDEAYVNPVAAEFLTGHIYTKLVGVPFKLNVAALNNSQIRTSYTDSGVTVKLVDNSVAPICVIDSTKAGYCSSTCTGKAAVASQTIAFTSTHQGKRLTGDFTLNSAYKNLVAIIDDGSTRACSTDAFAVRPTGFSPATTTTATNTGTAGTPVLKAGSDLFPITVSSVGIANNPSRYTGVPKINNALIQPVSPATVAGTLDGNFPAATSGTPSSTSTGTNFTYSETGVFTLPAGAIYDGVLASECGVTTPCSVSTKDTLKAATWTGVDSVSSRNDCVDESYSNTKNADGKYGCLIGTTGPTSFGRFIPHHFMLSNATLTNRSEITPACSPASSFTYMGEPIRANFTLTAQNASGGTTRNYKGALAKLDLSQPANFNLGALDSYPDNLARTITAITQENPGMVTTSSAHGYANNDIVFINAVRGMDEVNGRVYTISLVDSLRFRLVGVDTTGYEAYFGGGVVRKKSSSGTDLTSRLSLISSSGNWSTAPGSEGTANVALTYTLNRAAQPDGPLEPEFGIAPSDADGVKVSPYNMDFPPTAGNDHTSLGVSELLFGRLRLFNAHGSERLNLPISMRTEYWNGSVFVTNDMDSCTNIAGSNVALINYRGGINSNNMPAANVSINGVFVNGIGNLRLFRPLTTPANIAPASKGSVEACIDLGGTPDDSTCSATSSANMPWLWGNWRGATYTFDPRARATFGIFKNANEFIYIREMY